MKVGMNMLLWTTCVGEEHFPLFARLKETGFDGIEMPLATGDEAHYKKVGAELDALGLERTAVTSLMPETNPIDPDPAVRRAALDRLKWAIDVGHAAGIQMLCGPYHSAYAHFVGRGPNDDERRWCADVMREAAEYGQQAGIGMALEFLNRFECYFLTTAADARALADTIDHPNMGVLYDTHHAHVEEKDAAAAIELCEPRLRHVHIAENDRGTPGKGQVRWDETFGALEKAGFDGWMVIEAFSTADPDFAAAIHVWRDYEVDSEELARDGHRFIRESWAKTGGGA